MMFEMLGDLQLMVLALPTREVTQAVLDEELSKLATAAFPNQAQELYRTHYIRAARGLIRKFLIDNDKVIVESRWGRRLVCQIQWGRGSDMEEPTASEEEDGEFDVNAYLYPLPEQGDE
ncbi:hypothetical protein DCAR_0414958 [Daucus carota subsp. sativus]|uniref:Uncharacterized protein n=1 Tax=Daucus carota subsp. sativus TaxID=79200 RepID=A0AAF0WT60_DAUCS|nr:PREDICTED: uncharacterized protein LOC108218197 isoform X1 [Daucus carota subsp. sativus]WOG95632.1 hypothetical protein DCAR_0414958 [Daucus carota subsp. sativus]